MCLPIAAKKTNHKFAMCHSWQIQQSTKAEHVPRQQQQVETTEAVLITHAPIVGVNNSHNWSNLIDRNIIFVV